MHDQALVVLPALLARLAIERPVLVGHSDGASIALIYAGAGHPVTALVVLAPHVFVEDVSVAGIEAARDAYESTLRPRLAKYHDDVDATFWGWNGVWLSPEFRSWNIEFYLPAIEAPVLAIQGTEDQYGTLAQLDAIADGTAGATERLVVDGAGHVLHTGTTRSVVDAVAGFVERVSRPAC
jgi:pimeloyl-ACP methyl ester carboxylesterase